METFEFIKDKNILEEEKDDYIIETKSGDKFSLVKLLDEFSEQKSIRLLADFQNYKKRVSKEKEEVENNVKLKTLDSILEMDNDIFLALKTIKNKESVEGIEIILKKLKDFLKRNNIEEIQTEKYDPDLHEVVSVLTTENNYISDVVSKGYTLNGKPFKYPKIILGKIN